MRIGMIVAKIGSFSFPSKNINIDREEKLSSSSALRNERLAHGDKVGRAELAIRAPALHLHEAAPAVGII